LIHILKIKVFSQGQEGLDLIKSIESF
jgi:hypothetical protein